MNPFVPSRGRRQGLRCTSDAVIFHALATLCVVAACPAPALAWGDGGHRVIATIARGYLDLATRAKVDSILATDSDTLTAPDMASRATWADKWRDSGHHETSSWHFADIELDAPSVKQACFGTAAPATPASAGPMQDCVVDRVVAFAAELAAPSTSPAERLLALKYLLHFVGDLHQPLHASDNHDRGGNCVLVSLDSGRMLKLHAYWDTAVIVELSSDPTGLAATLAGQITPAQRVQWLRGSPADWAVETFQVSRATVYRVGSAPGCPGSSAATLLPPGYDAAARAAAALQLQRAGVRLAAVLTNALGGTMGAIPQTPTVVSRSATTTGHVSDPAPRSARSLACSGQADSLGLHGAPRREFRRHCITNGRGGAASS